MSCRCTVAIDNPALTNIVAKPVATAANAINPKSSGAKSRAKIGTENQLGDQNKGLPDSRKRSSADSSSLEIALQRLSIEIVDRLAHRRLAN